MANNNVIQIMCPKLTCRRILAVPVAARGKIVRCRGCGSTVRVPDAKLEQPVSADKNEAADASEEKDQSSPH